MKDYSNNEDFYNQGGERQRLIKIETELQNLKLATYDLLQAIQRIETNQQKLLFKKEIK